MKLFHQGIKSCHLAQASLTARIWQFGRHVLGGKLVIPWMKNFHFGVLAFLPGLSKCFHLSFLSDFFFTLCILKNHSSSLSAIFALPGFSQEIKNTYYRELSVAAVCTYYIVISFNHKRLNIPSDLTHLLVFCTFKFCQQILLEKACDYSADKHTRYFWT